MSDRRIITAAQGVVDRGGPRLVSGPWFRLDERGTIIEVGEGGPSSEDPDPVFDVGPSLLLPGMVNAHSHAFQRRIRGLTGRRGEADPSSFWSWREAMYEAANALDPEGLYRATRECFSEMLSAGITCVGEFHYVHHQPDGTPYDDPNELSSRVIAAAADVGIRLCLLEVFYERAAAGVRPSPEQRRFCDPDVDAYLARIDALRAIADAASVTVGITPHSVRAVTAPSLGRLSEYASQHDLVMHAHVSEQPRENTECETEHGMSPTQVLARAGCLDRARKFTAVHAVHVSDADIELLARQHVCACPTTEADLGDGIVPASRLQSAGAGLALGSDSNAVVDLVQEARLLEMGERLRTHGRLCLRDETGQVAPVLLGAATSGGASALGLPTIGRLAVGCPFDAAALDCRHPSLRDVNPEYRLDAVMLAGSAAPVHAVWVGGTRRF